MIEICYQFRIKNRCSTYGYGTDGNMSLIQFRSHIEPNLNRFSKRLAFSSYLGTYGAGKSWRVSNPI